MGTSLDRRPDCLVVAAHPDDEIIGAASLLMRCPIAGVVFLTDGAPRDARFWPPGAGSSREDYASLRRREAEAALSLAGIGGERLAFFDAVDQEAAVNLPALTQALVAHLRQQRPRALVAHPFEGGHPDHDSAAFVAHAARALLQRDGFEPPALWEMTSYHGRDGRRTVGEFLEPRGPETAVALSSEGMELKRRMLGCHASQAPVLAGLDTPVERLRAAPSYDFAQRPHPGPLYYEQLGFPLRSGDWMELARAASARLALPRWL